MDIDSCNGDSRLVVTELSLIKQLVTQLEVHLGESPELCKSLASKIFSVAELSIGIITSSSFNSGRKRSAADAGLSSATPSPVSQVADAPFKTNKKRKMTEKRTDRVRVSTGGGGKTAPVDDGYSWRKYGQKEILGAKHPRAYYRCTHRHSKGCEATKQVQRSDEDSELFDVYYLGTHTCGHKTTAAVHVQPPEHIPADAHRLVQSLTIETEGLTTAAEPQGWSAAAPFGFSSTPVSGGLAPEQSPFSAPSTSENWGVSTPDSNNVASFASVEAAHGDAEWLAPYENQDGDIHEDFLDAYISGFLV